jgi:hypothetical protein
MELVRDVLDKQIHDEQDCRIGKVDGLVVVLRQGRAPRVVALEVGLATLGARLHPACGRWLYRLERRWGVTKSDPVRILFEHVVKTGIDVVVNVSAHRTGALKWEDWLRDNIIGRIPGSQR